MSDPQFPSGEWVGFYTYANGSRKYLMDLVLEFKGGRMTGEGADEIGLFVISGTYSEQNGECAWMRANHVKTVATTEAVLSNKGKKNL